MSLKTVVRANNWWASKMPPLLAIAYAEILFHHSPLGLSLSLLAAVFWSLCSVASYGHVINDIFDIEQDRQAGKRNFMAPFTAAQQAGFALLTFAAGFLPLAWVHYGPAAIVAMLINFGLPTIYSIPPLRFKERGILGVLCDTSGAHLVPTIFIALAYANNASSPSPEAARFLFAAAPWAFVFGLKGILHHQLADRESDLIAGAVTFGTKSDPTRTLRFVSRILYWVELVTFAGVVATLWPVAPLVAACVPIYGGIELLKGWVGWTFAFDAAGEVRGKNVPFANNRFYELWMPVALATHLSLQQRSFLGVLVVHLWLFRGNLIEQWSEMGRLIAATGRALRNRRQEARWGLRLEMLENAEAELVPVGSEQVARAIVHRSGNEPWDVKVFSRRYSTTRGRAYRIRARVRAEPARRVAFGVCQGSDPWGGLGVSEEVPLFSEWREYLADFVADQDEVNARAYLWLGGEPIAVDIDGVTMSPIDENDAWTLDRVTGGEALLLASEDSERGCRVEVLSSQGRASDVKLSTGKWALISGETYQLRFLARSTGTRCIGVTVAERLPPWSDVGFSEPIELTESWEEFQFEISARRTTEASVAFLVGEAAGAVDVADVRCASIPARPTWRIECQDASRAKRVPLAGRSDGVGVIPLTVDGEPASIKLHARPVVVRKEGLYRVDLLARAMEPRSLLVEVAQDSAPWEGLGLSTTVALGAVWERWSRYFFATSDEPCATLQLGLGECTVPVEVAEARIEESDPKEAWFLDLGDECRAAWSFLDDSNRGIRVTVEAVTGNPAGIKLTSGRHGLERDTVYSLRFFARAPSPRWIVMGVGLAEDPWTNLGLDEEVELGGDWREHEIRFVSVDETPRATIYFLMGESEGVVEVRDVSLVSLPASPPPWVVRRQIPCRAMRGLTREEGHCRLSISRVDGTSSSLKLTRDAGNVTGGTAYRVRLGARADARRPARVELLFHAPDGPKIGFSEPVVLTPDWTHFSFDFLAPATGNHATLGICLGESDIDVEVAHGSMRSIELSEAWRLDRAEGCRAQVSESGDRDEGRRVEVLETTGKDANIKLSVGATPVARDRAYRVRFTARSERTRRIRFGASQRNEPWRSLGLLGEVELTPDWREHIEDFVAISDEPESTVHFWLGGEVGGVEWSDVTLSPSPISRPWRLERSDGCHAQPSHPFPDGRGIVVDLDAINGNPWGVKLSWQSFPVLRGQWGRLRFRARAAFPRRISVAMAQDHEPWANLGWSEVFPLTAEWRAFAVDVCPAADDSAARVFFGLGESLPAVSIEGVEWEPAGEGPRWLLVRHEETEAIRVAQPDLPTGTRIELDRVDGDPWHVKLCGGPFALAEGKVHTARFRARASSPRSILVGVSSFQAPWTNLGLNARLELSTDWQTFVIDGVVAKEDPRACLYFCLGESSPSVDIADASIVRAPDRRAWGIESHEGCSAQFLELEEGSAARRAFPLKGDGDPWHLKLVRGPFSLGAGRPYRMTFSARAPLSRRLRFGVGQSHAPWHVIGTGEEVELTTAWRTFVHDFRSAEEESLARFWFCLGESTIPVDLRDPALVESPDGDYWQLQRQGECRAERVVADGDPEAVRVELPAMAGEGWHVKLFRPAPGVQNGKWYRFHFLARADRSRPLTFGMGQSRSPWRNLGLSTTVQLTEDWQHLFRDFAADGDEDDAIEYFWLGEHAAAVEIKNVTRESIPATGAWVLALGGDSDAQLQLGAHDGSPTCRVVLRNTDGTDWKIKLNQLGHAVATGTKYRLNFRCRADAERTIAFGVGRASSTGESLGLFKEISVNQTWRDASVDFQATGDESTACVFFWLGKHASPFEVADVSLRPM